MSELRALYQEIIMDHGCAPRNFGVLQNATHSKEGFNPLCGDKIHLQMNAHAGVIQSLCFEGCGCAISMASASLMTEMLQGKSMTDAMKLFTLFHLLVTKGISESDKEKLGKLTVLGGVCEFPMRIKCATLAWHTLKALLMNDDQEHITTE